jgi:hypothetical protein
VAFGAILLIEGKDRAECYATLGRLVPSVKFDAENTKEAMYRINRPIASQALQGEQINRITTWNSIFVNQAVLTSAGAGIQQVLRHFARLECDNSTDAARKDPFSNRELGRILAELVALAYGNADSGELA